MCARVRACVRACACACDGVKLEEVFKHENGEDIKEERTIETEKADPKLDASL